MKLDELKQMIAEEFESYMKEEDVDVTVGDDDVDARMDKDPAEALEKIYQMLQDYFEADGEDNDMDGMKDEPGEEPMEEMSYEEDKEKELEENSTTAAQYQKSGFAAGKAGKGGTGYDGKAGKGGTGYDAGSKALQERFQKLANIVKG
tara:strand:+ start:188 stop:631 length:444 start_codon:yes stop_codon:yes gene_type:complete